MESIVSHIYGTAVSAAAILTVTNPPYFTNIMADVFVDFEGGNDENLITIDILNSGTHQGQGNWDLTGVVAGPRILTTDQALLASVIAADLAYTDSGATRCLIILKERLMIEDCFCRARLY